VISVTFGFDFDYCDGLAVNFICGTAVGDNTDLELKSLAMQRFGN